MAYTNKKGKRGGMMGKKSGKIGANRKYKDSVFKKLFGEKQKLAEVYNAIAGTKYAAGDIEIVTLENIIFIGRENDIAFTAGGRLIVLIEHQSTVNPNMPLRCLLYIAREYQTMGDNEAMYSKRLVQIMAPEFVVLYNGTEDYAEKTELKLSDAFMNKAAGLEVKVKVYNVNKGYNPKIMGKSGTLAGYAEFVAKARANMENGLEQAAALEKAVKECINDNILKEFLLTYGSDVINMLNMEWNLADALRVSHKDGLIEGIEKGMEKGIEKGIEKGMEKGIEKGIEKGELKRNMKLIEKMVRRGDSIDEIADFLEITIEEVKEAKNKLSL